MSPISKIYGWTGLQSQFAKWRSAGDRIVMTNGCFDLIHRGHIEYLHAARQKGDRLVIAVNTDASVKRLKGPDRPVKDETSRALVLASLYFVDAVTLFDQDTPLDLIQMLLPDVLVKGGDWATKDIVGGSEVVQAGGSVLSIPFVEGHSTTALIEKIKEQSK